MAALLTVVSEVADLVTLRISGGKPGSRILQRAMNQSRTIGQEPGVPV
jgi:hypothetical protein